VPPLSRKESSARIKRRPPIPAELSALIRKMANENPLWGEERIVNELMT